MRALVLRGELAADEVAGIAGVSTATGYRIVEVLRADGFVDRGGYDVVMRMRFPAHALPYLFPALAPTTPET